MILLAILAISAAENWRRVAARVPLHKAPLEEAIAWFMDEIHRLAHDGEIQRKMQLVAIEYPARLLLETWRKRNLN